VFGAVKVNAYADPNNEKPAHLIVIGGVKQVNYGCKIIHCVWIVKQKDI
jgi:hypothetical protein